MQLQQIWLAMWWLSVQTQPSLWVSAYLSLLIAFVIAGIGLVNVLLILRQTVAVGTTNGLIFYANIIAVNRTLFFPPDKTNIIKVFIAWANLVLGVET